MVAHNFEKYPEAHPGIIANPALGERKPRLHAKPWLPYGFGILLFAIVFGLWQVEPVPLSLHLEGVLVAALCLFPVAYWFSHHSQELPMFELICIAYLLSFSTPLYLQPNRISANGQLVFFSWNETAQTLHLVLLGIMAMLLGYYGCKRSRMLRPLPRIDLPLIGGKRKQFIYLALTIGLGCAFLETRGLQGGIFGAFVRVTQYQLITAIVMLAYKVYSGQGNQKELTLLYGSVTAFILFGLSTGLLENAIVPLVLLFVVRWQTTKKLPLLLIVISFLIFVVLNSVKSGYRSQVWYRLGSSQLTTVERITLWGDLSQETLGNLLNGSEDVGSIIQITTARFDLLHSFILVQSSTPSRIPFYGGRTYSYFIYGWIPRFLWPNKPEAQDANNIVAVDYGLIPPEAIGTTVIGIGHLPEAYANFGLLGMMIVMALQGVFYAALNRVLNGPLSDGGRATYLAIMVYFLNGIGSSTVQLFMSIIPNVAANALILRFFANGWQARPKQDAHSSVSYHQFNFRHNRRDNATGKL